MGRKRRRYNNDVHTCDCCGVNDDNVDEYSIEDADYYDYQGVKYYSYEEEVEDVDPDDMADECPPETLDDGWYCNICIDRAYSDFWEDESTEYTYDNNGNPYGDEDYGDDY